MSFRLSVYRLRQIKMNRRMTKYMQKEAKWKQYKIIKKNYKSKVSTCKLGSYCLRRMLYWVGISFELLSACLVPEVCQASNVFLIRKEPLSMTLELSKSMRWSNDHACFAMFDPLAQVLTFLTCSFLLLFLWIKPVII